MDTTTRIISVGNVTYADVLESKGNRQTRLKVNDRLIHMMLSGRITK